MQYTDNVRILEEQLRRAMMAGDVPSLSELIDDDLVFTGPMGNVMTKEEDLQAHRSGILRIKTLDTFEPKLHQIGDIVIATVKARLEATYDDHPVAGIFAYTRVWRKSDTGWRIVAGHCSRIGNL